MANWPVWLVAAELHHRSYRTVMLFCFSFNENSQRLVCSTSSQLQCANIIKYYLRLPLIN